MLADTNDLCEKNAKHGHQAFKGDNFLSLNAYRTLRISLAALILLLSFADLSSAAQTYMVRKGDTLHRISIRFGTTVSALQRVNNLSSYTIPVGSKLTIPSDNSEPRIVANGRVLSDELKVTSDGETIAELQNNTVFGIIGRDGDRLHVRLSDGRTGWVNAASVRMEEVKRLVQAADSYSDRQNMVRTALSYRGARYRRGGDSSSGFDCSGFVKHVFATMGIKLPHNSSSQYNYGTSVSKNQLKEGDVVFFAGTYRRGISHVGVYVGDGKFVHAATHKYGVRVDNLGADYYSRHYYGAKRIN